VGKATRDGYVLIALIYKVQIFAFGGHCSKANSITFNAVEQTDLTC
jgi:hypothetical protein